MKDHSLELDERRQRLSTLWLLVALNMILADVLSIFVHLVDGDQVDIPGDAKIMMLVGAVIVNVPIVMIYVSKYLALKSLAKVSTIAAAFSILAIIGGGSLTPHYVLVAMIEVLILAKIILDVQKIVD